jgi:hypothetical protein
MTVLQEKLEIKTEQVATLQEKVVELQHDVFESKQGHDTMRRNHTTASLQSKLERMDLKKEVAKKEETAKKLAAALVANGDDTR